MTASINVKGLPSDPVSHKYKSGDIVVTPDGFRFFLGTSAEHFFGTKPVPHDQAITDEDARRVGIEPLSVYQIATQACCDRMEEAGWPSIDPEDGMINVYADRLEKRIKTESAIEPDTTERVEATSITISLAKGIATDVALMHIVTRAATMLRADMGDWATVATWMQHRKHPR